MRLSLPAFCQRRASIHTEECVFQIGNESLAATKVFAASDRPPEVIAFHGTGATANRGKIRYVLDYLAGHGLSSLCFDFSGHGNSTGKMEQATLAIRKREAQAAFEFIHPQAPPVLIGTSMGGFIASLLAPAIQPRSLVLFCPAAYSAEAMELNFGESFTSATRKPDAYVNSPAFQALSSYRGKLLIVAAGKDMIIPREVIRLYEASAPLAKSKKTIWLEGSDHKIHSWLADHEAERESILHEVLAAT